MTHVDNQAVPFELQGHDHWSNFKSSVVGSLIIFCCAFFATLALRDKWAASDIERQQAVTQALAVAVVCSAFGVLLFIHRFERQVPGVNYGVVAGQGFCITLLVASWWFQALALPGVQSDAASYLILMVENLASAFLILCLGRFVINANVIGLSRPRVLLWLLSQALLEGLLVYIVIAHSLFTP